MDKLTKEFLEQVLAKDDVSVEDKIKLILAEAEADIQGLKLKNTELIGKNKELSVEITGMKEKETVTKTQITELQEQVKKNSSEETKKYLEQQYADKEKQLKTQLTEIEAERNKYKESHIKRLRDDAIEAGITDLKLIDGLKGGFVAKILMDHEFELHDIDGKEVFLDKSTSKPISAIMHEFALTNEGKSYIQVPFSGGGAQNKQKPGSSSTDKNPWKKGQVNLTEQCRITKENPQLAERLKAEAGA